MELKLDHLGKPVVIASGMDLLGYLISESNWLALLKDSNKNYNPLIDFLQDFSRNLNSETELPQIKLIASKLKIQSAKVTKLLQSMYNDIWDLNNESPELFKVENRYRYDFSFYDNHLDRQWFTLWLPNNLVVGNGFYWHFLEGKFSTSAFYIYEINHKYKNGELTARVICKSSQYNKYKTLLYEKAAFLNLLTPEDQYRKKDDELREIILSKVKL